MNKYREVFFPSSICPISKPITVASKGLDICIYFTVYHYTSEEANQYYAQNIVRAYHQLVECTNIVETGKILIYVDDIAYNSVADIFMSVGIKDSVRVFHNPMNYYNGGWCFTTPRLMFFGFEEPNECKYIFNSDDDMWWTKPVNFPKYDWKQFTNILDSKPDGLYAKKFDAALDNNKGRDKSYYECDHTASNLLQWVKRNFEGRYFAPPENYPYAWPGLSFTGIRSNSSTRAKLTELWMQISPIVWIDECFTELLHHYYQLEWVDIRSHALNYEFPIEGRPYEIDIHTLKTDYCLVNTGVNISDISDDMLSYFKEIYQ